MDPNPPSDAFPVNAVVFTGQFDRVRAGLAFLASGEIQHLLISGVNRGAGIHPERFATQFSLGKDMRTALSQGRLVLGVHATTTLENAAETRCWLRGIHHEGPILLITGTAHMPRASIALEHALPGTEVRRITVDKEEREGLRGAVFHEFAKYGATRAWLLAQSLLKISGLNAVGTGSRTGLSDCQST